MRHLEGLSWTEFSLYGQPPRAPRESRRRHGLVGRFMHTAQRDERREHARPPSSAHRRSAEDESPDLFGQSLRLRGAWEVLGPRRLTVDERLRAVPGRERQQSRAARSLLRQPRWVSEARLAEFPAQILRARQNGR